MAWKDHQYISKAKNDIEINALSQMHSQGMNPVSIEVMEKDSTYKAISLIDDPLRLLRAYGVLE
ncbi:MAG: hypothetical protein ABIF85_05900 [Nanoarchaeota archaeon]|nr:hypothetical protein [Nanoarchaeota archaeon]MBU4300310.1 hypothetical protein [Nanoarchaeota archaeon]MBU4452043.1 hypothetical protein [Nanoarchaeota archaeon]MCG2723182.1 hypothetical protein [archaeon]